MKKIWYNKVTKKEGMVFPLRFGKSTLAILLSGSMLLSTGAAVLAEEDVSGEGTATATVTNTAVTEESKKLEVVQVSDLLKDQENWAAEAGALDFASDQASFTKKTRNIFTYTGKEFTNETLQFKFSINFDNNNWGGFGLKGLSKDTVAWSGNYSYLVVFKEKQFELQRFSNAGNKFLAIVDNNGIVKSDQECNVTFGAVEVEGGVQLFMYIDGKLVFNCFDNDGNALTNAGYLSFYSGSKATVGAYDAKDELPDIPACLALSGSAADGAVKASYSTLELSGKGEAPILRWGVSEDANGQLTDIQKQGMSDFKDKYSPVGQYPWAENVTGDTYTITDADKNHYIAAYLVDKDGAVLATSDAYFYDTLGEAKKKMIALALDYEQALVFGNKIQIDPNDPSVTPVLVGDRTLVPLRFISENLGAEVQWDEETQTVTITANSIEIKMQLGKKEYTINGETKEMDTEAVSMHDRTMVPLRVISESFGNHVFWDDKGLIIISPEALDLDSERDAGVIDSMLEDIQNYY